MRMSNRFLGLAVLLANCVRPPAPRPVPVEDDRSIVFPNFFEHSAIKVGPEEKAYELDGTLLRAIRIAANDFLPPGGDEQPCWNRQEAYRYRVIRQGDIIFVRIIEDVDFCGLNSVSVDSGAKYAISRDGRILRRILGAEPEASSMPETPDAGVPDGANEPGLAPTPDAAQPLEPHGAVTDGGSPGGP